jgi:hypothetical protein
VSLARLRSSSILSRDRASVLYLHSHLDVQAPRGVSMLLRGYCVRYKFDLINSFIHLLIHSFIHSFIHSPSAESPMVGADVKPYHQSSFIHLLFLLLLVTCKAQQHSPSVVPKDAKVKSKDTAMADE